MELVGDLQGHGFGFFSKFVKNTGRHDGFVKDIIAVDIFLHRKDGVVGAIARYKDGDFQVEIHKLFQNTLGRVS